MALPPGYTLDWGSEYSEYVAARQQFAIIGPLAVLLIFMILFALYGNFKFPVTVVIGVVMTEPVGAMIALKLTHTPFSVSSVLGLLALAGCFRRDSCHPGLLHQQIASGKSQHPGGHARSRAAAAAAQS